MNPNNDRNPDGNFDFFPGITIDPDLGRIIFPTVEPFGNYLATKFVAGTEQGLIDKYVYSELYNRTQTDAAQVQEKDKFFLRGRFQGAAGADLIALPGFGIAQGSVRLYSGSTLLVEGTDYQVFYDQAQVKILNPAYLNSANELRVTFEKNAVVQVQPRKLVGARFDYRLSPDINLGATVLHLIENQAPGINRVGIGDEPNNNTIYGFDVNLRRESRVLTKYLNALPIVSTKAPSSVAFSGEFAQLLPGKSNPARARRERRVLPRRLRKCAHALHPGRAELLHALAAGRSPPCPCPAPASTACPSPTTAPSWPGTPSTRPTTPTAPASPPTSGAEDVKNHYVRGIKRTELFPNRDVGATGNGYEYPLDLAYFPQERGQYNYNPRVAADRRTLPTARDNYGGISREITLRHRLRQRQRGVPGVLDDGPLHQERQGLQRARRPAGHPHGGLRQPRRRLLPEPGLGVGGRAARQQPVRVRERHCPTAHGPTPWPRNLVLAHALGQGDHPAVHHRRLFERHANGARALQDIGLDG